MSARPEHRGAVTLPLPKSMRKKRMLPAGVSLLDKADTSIMQRVCGTSPDIRIVPYSELATIGLNEIRLWCLQNGVYQVPTQELIAYLGTLIEGYATPIEICSGNGAIGRALDIPRTDSYMHDRPEIQALYRKMGQPITRPPDDVLNLEAMQAVRQFNPDVVVGTYCTQLGTPDVEQSSPFGVDERKLLKHPSVKRYIMVGNEISHGKKRIRGKLTEQLGPFPWLVSRSEDQGLNRIYVWDL